MRWVVEVSAIGKTDLQKFCVEAESWQRALQAARAQRGEEGPMSGFSIELLEEGYRAVDPLARIRFVVKRAPDDMPVTAPPAKTDKGGVAPSPASAAAPGAADRTQPISIPPAAPTVTKSVPPRPGVPIEKPGGPAAAAPPAAPSSTAKKGSSVPPAPKLPVGSFIPGLPSVKVLSAREQDPTEASPLTYREYSFAVAAGTSEEVAANVLKGQLRIVDGLIEDAKMGKLVNLAVFDVEFTGKPPGPPLATLTWKDWKGDPVIGFPRRGTGPAQVKPPATASGTQPAVSAPGASAPVHPPPSTAVSPSPALPASTARGPGSPDPRPEGTGAIPRPGAPASASAPTSSPAASAVPAPPSSGSGASRSGGPYPTPQVLRAMVQAAKVQSEPRLPTAAKAQTPGWPLVQPTGAAVAPVPPPHSPIPIPPPFAPASQPPPAPPNPFAPASQPPPAPPNPFTAASQPPPAQNPFTASQPPPNPFTASQPPPNPFTASQPPPPPNPFTSASQPPPAPPNPFAPASQPPPAGANPFGNAPNPFAAPAVPTFGPASAPPPPPGSFPPPAMAVAPVQAFAPASVPPPAQHGSMSPPPGSMPPPQHGSMPPPGSIPPQGYPQPAMKPSDPPRRASRPSHPVAGPDGMVRTPSGRFVRGRTTGDELITALFESMHDLHFLRDALDGGQFCLALATEVLPARAALIHFFDIEKREWVVACTRGKDTGRLLTLRTPESDALLRDAARQRRAVVTPNAAATATAQRYQTLGGSRSMIIAPIMQAGRALGAIEIINPLDGMPFTEDEGNAMTYIAEQFAEYLGSRGIVVDSTRIQNAANAR